PGAIFDQLAALSLIRLHADAERLHDHVARHRNNGEAVTVATNDEAARLNERIRVQRAGAGAVGGETIATGSDGLSIGRGDLIQTRKNDTALGVANRQLWIVQQVETNGTVWVVEEGSDRKREYSVRLPAAYVTEHAHIAYASTAYGVQGVTASASHTILSDTMSAAAVYVGMTRGTGENQLHIIAENTAEARQQFNDSLEPH